jgi:hypothetical protein
MPRWSIRRAGKRLLCHSYRVVTAVAGGGGGAWLVRGSGA